MCSVCQKLGVFDQLLPNTAHQHDIFGEGECQLDEVPGEVAPCEEWLLDEVELNTLTIRNMSIDGKLVEPDGKRGRHREITVDSSAENQW